MRRNSPSTCGNSRFRHSWSPALQRSSSSVTDADSAWPKTFSPVAVPSQEIISPLEGAEAGFEVQSQNPLRGGDMKRTLLISGLLSAVAAFAGEHMTVAVCNFGELPHRKSTRLNSSHLGISYAV